MAKFELSKSIEATPLNKRTGIPTSDPPVTIPFGGIVEHSERDREFDKFTYLGQPFRCAHDVFKAAVRAPGAAATAKHEASAPRRSALIWQELCGSPFTVRRTKVPGGWLVMAGESLAFYPDPQHAWDGTSLP